MPSEDKEIILSDAETVSETDTPETEQIDPGRRSMLKDILLGTGAVVIAAQPGCASVMRILGKDKAVDEMVRKFKEKEGVRHLGAQTLTAAVNYGIGDNFGQALAEAVKKNAEKLSTSEKKLTAADLESRPVEGFARKLDDGRFIVFARSSVKGIGPASSETVKKQASPKELYLKEHGFSPQEKIKDLSGGAVAAYGEGGSYGQALTDAISALRSKGHTHDPSVLPVPKNFSGNWVVIVRGKKVEVKKHYKERHERLRHPKNGIVHYWYPEHSGSLDEVVVFLHGYNHSSTIDTYWNHMYKLEDQFRESGKKALFIAPQTQKGDKDAVRWQFDLKGLIDFVKSKSDVEVGENVTVISHSGGYVTALHWLNHEDLNTIILSDGVFKYSDRFHPWLKKQGKRMILISTDQSRGSIRRHKKFLRRYSDYPVFDGTPDAVDKKTANSKLVHIKSPYSHHDIPTKRSGIIPKLLRLFGKKSR